METLFINIPNDIDATQKDQTCNSVRQMKKIITKNLICQGIDRVLKKELPLQKFGEEMFDYLSFVGEKYEFETGYEQLLSEILGEFMDLHDVGKEGLSYTPHIPSEHELMRIKKLLETAPKK